MISESILKLKFNLSTIVGRPAVVNVHLDVHTPMQLP